jgi:acyl-homoserine lactone acylase PvdQ
VPALRVAVAFSLLTAAPASAQLPPLPIPTPAPTVAPGNYQADDGGGFRSILPSGTRGRYSLTELAAFLTTGVTVPHCCDQLPMYDGLNRAVPGLTAAAVPRYFKDASFGVPAGQAERTYSPRADVTIVRDRAFGVPHVYGRARSGAMFGLGYAGAEDRLFFMDVLRHAGRGELSSFAGGANQAQDAEQWAVAPYTEADLERQARDLPRYLGAQGAQIVADVDQYVAGINQYILEARLDPAKLPGEYAAIGRPLGPDPFKPADLIATAAMVGGIFGKGGGGELEFSRLADALEARFGRTLGDRVFRDFRSAEDPEAPVTVRSRRFPYQVPPRRPRGVARPDPGSFKASQPATGGSILGFPARASNALLVAGAHSKSGHPLMVAGPQVGYFNPQILMEEDVHAPASAGGPGIDAQGASFVGINLYVQLGRGRDYAWSATSAGQDIIDTFAVPLCDATHYRFRGACEPIEVLEKTNAWVPTAADQTPPGTQRLRAERTKLGIVAGRGTVHGRPVLFTKLRSTYFHEVDSAAGFMDFNTPAAVRDPASFQRAAAKIGYTFNWFYADDRHIAYFNSGDNPVRAARVDHDFPVSATYEWRGWDPASWRARFTPASEHPQVVDQDHLVNWNNKQARGYRSADENAYSSTYRSVLLEDRVKAGIAGGRKMDLAQLIGAMALAGTEDLRAHADLPLALRVIGSSREPAVAKLRAWLRDGALRKDADGDGVYEHADAIRIMDAWWPRWLRAQFEPVLGRTAFDTLTATIATDNPPNNHGEHLGSAFQGSWYGFASKDLRTVLGDKVRGRYARTYCGGGSLARCRRALLKSLKAAAAVPASEVYGGDKVCADAGKAGDQWCFDAVRQRPIGAATQPLIAWINRPTFQQAVEVQTHVAR